jgi:DNA-binding response OmpR family regulator
VQETTLINKTKVLVVEDNLEISKLISDYLLSRDYDVAVFDDGPEALKHVKQNGLPHIALIDLTLTTMHGFELSGKLKAMGDVPIIFVSAETETDIVVQGLKRYADDFIVKPFNLRELEARVQTVLSRMPSLDYASQPVAIIDDNLSIDFAHNRITVGGKTHSLTPTESILLHVLLRNAGRVVENRLLIARVWPSEEVFEDTLRVHMHRLRRKLESDSHHPHYIRTERGIGYVFTMRPSEMPETVENGQADAE